MSLMIEDFCIQRTIGVAGRVSSFDDRMIEEVCSGWFDGAILLEFFAEIIERHGEDFPEKNSRDMKMSFWKMTESNPNRSDEVGAVVCIQVGEESYAICPVRRGD